MKKVLVFLMFFVNISCFAATNTQPSLAAPLPEKMILQVCQRAVPTSDPAFCTSFKASAYCHCHDEHGMPPILCNDMGRLLQIMILTYGSLSNACSPRVQKDVPQQECIDDWNYYSAHC